MDVRIATALALEACGVLGVVVVVGRTIDLANIREVRPDIEEVLPRTGALPDPSIIDGTGRLTGSAGRPIL
jgi:hypothetical protein